MSLSQSKLANFNSFVFPKNIESDTGERIRTRNFFILICSIYLIIWTLLPAVLMHNPPTDSLEGLVWGRLWQWGYPKHPFLAPWLTALFTDIFHTVGWPIYLLGQLSCIACFWGVWLLANQLLRPWQALISAMLLTTVQYYNIAAYIFDPNVLSLPMWVWLGFYFHQAVTQQKFHFWLLTGLFAGLSLLSKYESGLLIFLLFLLLFTTPQGRVSWKQPGVYTAALLTMIVFAPNFYYLYHHQLNAVNYALGEMNHVQHNLFLRFYRPFNFFIMNLGNLVPWLILFMPLYRSCTSNRWGSLNGFQRQFLFVLGLGPLLFTVIAAIIMNANLVQRWGFPFFSFTGILWVAWLNPQLNLNQVKIFLRIWLAVSILMVLGFTLVTGLLTYLENPTKGKVHNNFPGKQITLQVQQQWKNYSNQPLLYVAGDLQYVSNIVSFAPTKMIPFFLGDIDQSPWINLNAFKQAGGVFVYPAQTLKNKEAILLVKQQYPAINKELILEEPPLTWNKAPKIKYWIGFLPPQRL